MPKDTFRLYRSILGSIGQTPPFEHIIYWAYALLIKFATRYRMMVVIKGKPSLRPSIRLASAL